MIPYCVLSDISCSGTFIMLCFHNTVSYVWVISSIINHNEPSVQSPLSSILSDSYKITPRFNPREVMNFNPVKAAWQIISPLRSRRPRDECRRERLWVVSCVFQVQNKPGRQCFDALVHPIIVRRTQMPYLHAQTHTITVSSLRLRHMLC